MGDLLMDIEAGRSFKCSERPAGPDEWGVIKVSAMTWREFGEGENKAVLRDHKIDPRFEIQSGDLLFSRANTVTYVGAVVQVGETRPRLLLSDKSLRLVPHHSVSPRWLLYYLRTRQARQYLESLATGTSDSMRNISQASLRGLPIPLAPRREQERIVAAIEEQFSRIDAGVAALERVRQNLKRQRNVALAGLGDSVSDWTTLGAIADVVGGITKDAKRQSDPSFVEVPYLRVANVQRGYLDLGMVTTIRVPVDKAKKLRLETGDVLFNEGGDRDKLGRGWVWQGQIPDCIHQNHVFRARLTGGAFEPKFVSMHGNTYGRNWFEQMGKQTTNLASLNLTTLKSFPVPVLQIDEQRMRVANIEQRMSGIEALDVAVKDALRRSEQLRSSILAAAFSDKLTHQDPTDEPASALIERIAAKRATSNVHKPARSRTPRTKVTHER
jgi:type I restriction enzyme S subunit